MKKILIFAMLLILAPLVHAITTNMAATYQPGGTMIIEISGSILQPISASDVIFKRAHVAIAAIYDIKRIGAKYYLYAQLPLQPNNYTLFINDIETTVNGINTIIDFNQTFSVAGETVDYSINPGFAVVSNSLILTATLNKDQPEAINLNFPEEQAFTLQPGYNTITLSTSSVSPGIYQAVIGRYTLPIQVLSAPQANQTTIQNISLQITPSAIRVVALENTSTSYKMIIINNGQSIAENIILSFNTNLLNITPYFIISLQPNASQELNISLKRVMGQPIISEILIQAGEYNKTIPVNISFTTNVTQITQINDNRSQSYCSELNGKFCTTVEVCSIEPTQALDGSCCTGTCEAESSSGGYGWLGYVAIAIVLLIIIIIYFRYRKSAIPKPKNLAAPPSRAIPSATENSLHLPPGFPSKIEKK